MLKKIDNFKTSKWSGGKTVEMFLYPENSSYEKRDFICRISSATVEASSSVFTILPGYKRFLMPIDNKFILTHKKGDESREVELEPTHIDCFDGADETVCRGSGRDFNLMVKTDTHGKMIYFTGGNVIFSGDLLFIYALEDLKAGKIGETELKKGEIAMSDDKGKYYISGESIVICVGFRNSYN